MKKRTAKKIVKKYKRILDAAAQRFMLFRPTKKLIGYSGATVHEAYRKLGLK